MCYLSSSWLKREKYSHTNDRYIITDYYNFLLLKNNLESLLNMLDGISVLVENFLKSEIHPDTKKSKNTLINIISVHMFRIPEPLQTSKAIFGMNST